MSTQHPTPTGEPLPIDWLPDEAGYKFTGITADGHRIPFEVVESSNGGVYANPTDGSNYAMTDLVGWEPL